MITRALVAIVKISIWCCDKVGLYSNVGIIGMGMLVIASMLGILTLLSICILHVIDAKFWQVYVLLILVTMFVNNSFTKIPGEEL